MRPPMTAGPDTYLGQLVSLAGGEPAFPELGARFANVSLEELVRRQPEVGDGWVRFVQTTGGRTGVPAPRRVRRRPFVQFRAPLVWTTLALTLHGDLESIERADFQGDVVFLDGTTRGEADLAVYDAAKERVHLTPGNRTPPRIPQVRDEQVTVNGLSIDIDMKTHDFVARGTVTTVSKPGGERRAGALFDGDDPVLGAGAEVDYRRASRAATASATWPGGPGDRHHLLREPHNFCGINTTCEATRSLPHQRQNPLQGLMPPCGAAVTTQRPLGG